MGNKITVAEFEDKVWAKEGVRIVIRASQSDMVDDYDYQRNCSSTSSITELGNRRIKPKLAGLDFFVVDGTGTRPHGRTQLDKVRESYK